MVKVNLRRPRRRQSPSYRFIVIYSLLVLLLRLTLQQNHGYLSLVIRDSVVTTDGSPSQGGPLVGVTSLVAWDDETIVVGPKCGIVYSINTVHTLRSKSLLPMDESKYPFHRLCRMDVDTDTKYSYLCCGGGDRWISVWQQQEDIQKENDQLPNKIKDRSPTFQFVQKLGPHTGWVKSVVWDVSLGILHSVGCNCIESWVHRRSRSSTSDSNDVISHLAKRSIESCPKLGTTLSSDLLCLSCVPPFHHEGYQKLDGRTRANDSSSYLVSGGVDGRIHLWTSDPRQNAHPIDVVRGHDGRVNAMEYSKSLKILISVGNDCIIQAYTISSSAKLEHRATLPINSLMQSTENKPGRLTAARFIDEDENNVTSQRLIVGTSHGEAVDVIVRHDYEAANDVMLSVVGIYSIFNKTSPSVIYDMSYSKASSTLWLGHADGLAVANLKPLDGGLE